LVGRLDRSRNLLLEVARAPVPKHRGGPSEIPQGRGMTFERTAGHAACLHFAVSETFAALVASGAGQAAVDRQSLVVEKRFAERALLLREWIVGRKRNGRRPAKRRLERGKLIRRSRRWRRLQDRGMDQRRRCANHPAHHKRRGREAHRDRRVQGRHISVPAASSMRETSPSTAPWSLTGACGGMGEGNAFFSSAIPARISLSAGAFFFCRSTATLSIMRSACQTKPRAS